MQDVHMRCSPGSKHPDKSAPNSPVLLQGVQEQMRAFRAQSLAFFSYMMSHKKLVSKGEEKKGVHQSPSGR
jgi:hypothetical protein